MNRVKKNSGSNLSGPLVVGAVHTQAGLHLAAGLGKRDLDLIEIRLDALADSMNGVRRLLEKASLPVLLTVRHPAEGGIGNLPVKRRRELFRELLPATAFMDVELRSVVALREEIACARESGIRVVVSDHHFRRTPTLAEMRERRKRGFAAGADIFKLACLADGPSSVARLLDFTSESKAGPVAVMGMGKMGQVSRLVLACAGSILNYGYLDKPNAPGQWEARELRKLLRLLERGRIGAPHRHHYV